MIRVRNRAIGIGIGLVLAVAAALTACSGGSGSSTPGASGAASGDPIKIGIITPIGTSSQNYPDNVAAANAAALAVNNAGGIQGRPIQIDSCNEGYDPNKATACARQMIDDGVIGTVRDYSVNNGALITSLLQAASVPQVFAGALQPDQFKSNNYFPADIGSGFSPAALVQFLAQKDSAKSVALANLAIPSTALGAQAAQNAAQNMGISWLGSTDIPADAADYSVYASKIVAEHPDSVVMNMPDPMIAQLVPALKAAGGASIKIAVSSTSLTQTTLGQFGSAGDGIVIGGFLPPPVAAPQFPGLQAYNTEMAAELATGDQAADVSKAAASSTTAWLGVHAIAQVAQNLKTLDAPTLLSTLQSAKNIDLQGLMTWSPGATGTIPDYPQISNFTYYFYSTAGGKFTADGMQKLDVTASLKGM
jgi:ABC-type branched-subunit amino acid transport system substrate-binding protein